MALALPKSKLYEANARSSAVWRTDLRNLFDHAKERYADVVWTVIAEDETEGEDIYGHKAVVYARAPTGFQAQYFSFRPPPSATPDPYGPDESSYSLQIDPPSPSDSLMHDHYDRLRSGSPSSQAGDKILRLTTSANPALFTNELEYLYTAEGMGEAFEFLFDAPEQRDYNDSEEDRIDKLKKDFCYMWRSRLFSDVRIALTGDFRPPESASDTEDTAVVFFSHRFILVSRSPYFHKVLQSSFRAPTAPLDGSMLTLELPSSAFTPASLHWALGFMYSGTLNFSHRTFDLDTAFAITRSAAYLLMATMRVEIEAHIIEEMLHGLFHAYLTFDEYEKITAGKWGVGGCRCRQCQRRVPRVLEFSLAPDIANKTLERGARRALVGMFGEGWCSSEFAGLPTKMRALLLKGVQTRTTPQNIFPLLFSAELAVGKLEAITDSWKESVHELILKARKTIDDTLCDQSETCFEQQEWLEIMDSDGAQFQDMDKVSWIMASVIRGLKDTNAPLVYQTLVSSILLRPHPTDTSATLLPNTSPVRTRVEETRSEVIRWLRKHWIAVRLANGFESLQPWSLKEISHELEMNIPDLLSPPSANKGATSRTGLRVTTPKDNLDPEMDGESITASSMRASVLNRNMAKSNTTTGNDSRREPVQSVRVSIRSNPNKARNSATETDRDSLAISTSTFSSARSLVHPEASSPTSSSPSTPRLLGTSFSRSGTTESAATASENHTTEPSPTTTAAPPSRNVPGRRTVVNSTTSATDSPAAGRPRSIAASVKSTTSTIRRGGVSPTTTAVSAGPNAGQNTIKGKPEPRKSITTPTTTTSGTRGALRSSLAPSTSRPSSRVSDVSSFKSAKSELEVPPVPRPRTQSMASTTSTVSVATDGGSTTAVARAGGRTRNNLQVTTPRAIRPRKTSDASVISTASLSHPRGNVTPKRPSSQASVRSTTSSKAPTTKRTPTRSDPKVPDLPKRVTKTSTTSKSSSIKSTTKATGAPAAPATTKADTKKTETKVTVVTPAAPPVVVHEDTDSTEAPPPLPSKDTQDVPPTESGLAVTSQKDKRPSASSTMSTNSGSTIRIIRKKSNDTITEKTEKDVSTLRAKTLAKLVGGPEATSSPTRPSAAEAVIPPPSTVPAPVMPHQDSTLPPQQSTVPAAATSSYIPPQYINGVLEPQGITLNVGIPCIITSKRARFRAFARYLGEVMGEIGPWVGVEVPLGESATLEGRDWHDGSWNGIRYFEIRGSNWEDEERARKRRRMDQFGSGRKRDPDSLSVDQRSTRRMRSVSPAVSDTSTYESRGLFVRPQQVLYVIDARADY